MMEQTSRQKHRPLYTVAVVVYALVLNLMLPRLVGIMGWPIYLDGIGIVGASVLGGFIPGIITGFATNAMNAFFDSASIYYSIISILIAIASLYYITKGKFNKISGIVQLILILTFIGGFLGGLITWFLYGPATEGFIANANEWITGTIGLGVFTSQMIVTVFVDLIDKTITVLAVVLLLRVLPKDIREYTWMSGWHQAPLSKEMMEKMKSARYRGMSLRVKIALILILTSLAIALSLAVVSYHMFTNYTHDQNVKVATTTASLAAAAIDPEKVDQFIEEGEDAPGYKKTEKMLYSIRESSPSIEYVYVYQIREDGCHVVFDLDTEELEGAEPGDLVPFDVSFEEYLPALLAGQPIEPVESNDTYGWLLTVYEPVYDADGKCVCYAAADISVEEILTYERGFLMKLILVFLGFFFLLFSVSLNLSKYHVVLPVKSMASCASAFALNEEETQTIEEGMEHIQNLKIETGEEVEELYHALCKMCADLIDRMHNIQHQAQTINDMQSGLILVMADMVESRDSNTGEHIHKTAAYTQIVAQGLKRKGYYADQLTDQHIEDITKSAPLHDVGKIKVSDTILNKPGRLTDEEFEIMKTHTTAGYEILKQASDKVRGESYLSEAINMATYHHEKWDGSGYPKGLKGEEIPLSARIMAIADVFDALTSKRVYKDAMPFEKAVSIIQKDAGTHFDPKCVEAFTDSLDEVKSAHERITGTALEDL